MKIKIEKLQKTLCETLCADIKLIPKNKDLLLVENPFFFPDGDPYQIYITELPTGILRLSDMGHTMMHLSYENDIDKFKQGTRGELFEKIIAEMDINEDEGQIFIDSSPEDVANNIFRLGQALTKIYDLTFLNRAKVQATIRLIISSKGNTIRYLFSVFQTEIRQD